MAAISSERLTGTSTSMASDWSAAYACLWDLVFDWLVLSEVIPETSVLRSSSVAYLRRAILKSLENLEYICFGMERVSSKCARYASSSSLSEEVRCELTTSDEGVVLESASVLNFLLKSIAICNLLVREVLLLIE